VLSRLRAATAQSHQALERRLDIVRRIATVDGRRGLVERFAALHHGAHLRMGPWLEDLGGLDYHARNRRDLFREDLAALGSPPVESLPACAVPPLKSRAAALGLFYVLEGSSLGGRVIRRHVEQDRGEMLGLSFLDPYGVDVGQMWKRFVLVLEREIPSSSGRLFEDLVGGARDGFELATAWLCSPDPQP